jgi:CsoR family transcriptional regulator, copper-sensing transcriptional repressor
MVAEHKTYGYAEQRGALVKRVNRLEGQVRGVGRMIEDDRYCIDIVDQLSAIQAAARRLSLQILEGHVRHCVMDAAQTDDAEPKLHELMATLDRAMSH